MLKPLILMSTLLYSISTQADDFNKAFTEKNQENIHRNTNELILTFDDGPTPGVTDKVLDILKKYNVKATFFVIGSKALAAPELMKRMVDEGHLVGNHSMTHPNLSDLGLFWRKKLSNEILGAHQALLPYIKNNREWYFRAPGAGWESKLARFLNDNEIGERYIGPLLWDIGGELKRDNNNTPTKAADWNCWAQKWTVKECATGYLSETKQSKGGVVLMHDLRSSSAELLEIYLEETLKEGFKYINLDDISFNR